MSNRCRHKYEPSITRFFKNLIFGGLLQFGPTVYQRVGEAQPPPYFLTIRPFSVALALPPALPQPSRRRAGSVHFNFPPEIVQQNAVEHSVTSPAYRLRQIDIPVKLLLSPCKLCCPSLQCSFVVISPKTLGMTLVTFMCPCAELTSVST